MSQEAPDCPRCTELRGRAVKMHAIETTHDNKDIASAYECPSCDYVIVLRPL